MVELTSSHLCFAAHSPSVATVACFWPDHLELHGSLDRYRAAKEAIVRGQRADDVVVANEDDDGAMAIAYARSRSADSDYQRMGRQRQLLAALGSQVSAREALSGFGSVTGALDDSMRTSLSAGEFASLLDRLGDNAKIGESVGLTPPLIQPGNPDYAQIRQIIDAVQNFVLTGQPSGFAA